MSDKEINRSEEPTKTNLRRSSRLNLHLHTVSKVLLLQTIISQRHKSSIKGEIFGLESISGKQEDEEAANDHPLVYKASTDPDTMYMHQAVKTT